MAQDPIELAQQNAANSRQNSLQQRIDRQLEQDSAELPTFWQGYNPGLNRHSITRLGHESTDSGISISSGGYTQGQRIDAAYGQNYTAIDTRPYIPRREETVTTSIPNPDIKIFYSRNIPISGTTLSGENYKCYLKINQNPVFEVGSLASQFQDYVDSEDGLLSEPSEFLFVHSILVNKSTVIAQVRERWRSRASVEDDFTYYGAFFTYVINRTDITSYVSPVLTFTPGDSAKPIVYDSALDPYINYLIPTYFGALDARGTPPILTSFASAPITVFHYFYKGKQYWIQIRNSSGKLANGRGSQSEISWFYYLRDHNYSISTKSDPTSIEIPLLDNTYPGYQIIKTKESDLIVMGLNYDTPVYNSSDQSTTLLGTVADALDPNSTFATSTQPSHLYFGATGEYKGSLIVSGVRGVLNT